MISSLLTCSKPPTLDFLPLMISSPSLTRSRSPHHPRSPPYSPLPTHHRGDSLLLPPATAATLHLSDLCFADVFASLLLHKIPHHLHPRPRKKETDDTPSPPPSPCVIPSASSSSTETTSLFLFTLSASSPSVGTASPSSATRLLTPPPYEPHQAFLLALILSNLCFQELAMAMPGMYSLVLSAWSGPLTLFAPSANSLHSCPSCSPLRLLREHLIPGLFSLPYLSKLTFGTKLKTASPDHCLTVTSSSTPLLSVRSLPPSPSHGSPLRSLPPSPPSDT